MTAIQFPTDTPLRAVQQPAVQQFSSQQFSSLAVYNPQQDTSSQLPSILDYPPSLIALHH